MIFLGIDRASLALAVRDERARVTLVDLLQRDAGRDHQHDSLLPLLPSVKICMCRVSSVVSSGVTAIFEIPHP